MAIYTMYEEQPRLAWNLIRVSFLVGPNMYVHITGEKIKLFTTLYSSPLGFNSEIVI